MKLAGMPLRTFLGRTLKRYTWIICLLAAVMTISSADAEVAWERLEQRQTAGPADETITFTFPFTVSGDAVRFLPTEIPCECAFADPDRPTYQPGEHGVFTVRMQVEDRVGEQEVEVTTATDDPQHPKGTLKLIAVIPELLRFTKKIVVWDAKSGSGQQRLSCTVAAGYTITTATATSQHSSVTASIAKSADPQVFHLDLALAATDYHKPVKITVTTDLPVKRQASATIWAVNRLP